MAAPHAATRESGPPVIHTPPLNPAASGFDISILASDTLGGKGETCWGRKTEDLRQETCGDIKTARH